MNDAEKEDLRAILREEVSRLESRIDAMEQRWNKVMAFVAVGKWLLPLAMMALLTTSSMPDDARQHLMGKLVELLK